MELTLNENLSTQALENEDEGYVTVDPDTRMLKFPNENFFLGVSGDQDSRLIHFKFVDDITDAIKLSEQEIQINYLNANQEKGYDVALNKKVQDGYCYFDWKPSSKVFLYAGDVNFLVCARSKNEVSGFKKTDWNTVRSTHTVPEGIEPEDTHVDEQTDETITNLLLKINESVTASANSEKAAKTSADQANASASAASASASSASGSASGASNSATAASNSATAASNSATAASNSANDASNSATAASNSATAASNSATNAATSATAASNSAEDASNSAGASATSADSSKNSADASAASATKAKASETAAAKSLSDLNNNTKDVYQKLAAFDSLGFYVDEGGYLCQK